MYLWFFEGFTIETFDQRIIHIGYPEELLQGR